MQIANINRYLLSNYEESVLKIFKHFSPLGLCSLGEDFWYFNIS